MSQPATALPIEVDGRATRALVAGFGSYTATAARYLLPEGLADLNADGTLEVDPARWYPREAWLRAVSQIGQEIGDSALHLIGSCIPSNAVFPAWVLDVDSALRALDIAYHLNHRLAGQVMFDEASGAMTEGIGHYGYAREGERRIVSVCDGPYPCAFDLGIYTALVRRFGKGGRVEHDPAEPCRAHGDASCTYVIRW